MEAQVVAFVEELKAVRVGIFTADVWRSFGSCWWVACCSSCSAARWWAVPCGCGLGLLWVPRAEVYSVTRTTTRTAAVT